MTKFELSRTGYNTEAARDYNCNLLRSLGILVQKADVKNLGTLLDCAKGCDYIVHTAAQPAMTIALEQPLMDFKENALGTLNVLEAARQLSIPAAVCSTIHVYGNGRRGVRRNAYDWYTEDYRTLTGEITPLHASKYAGELYARCYMESYGCRVAVFRLTGIYGQRQFGGEDHGWVANFAIRTVLGMPIRVFGTDRQYRDILYVEDAARAFLEWFETGCPSGVYNIGGGGQCLTTIRDCLRILRELTGKEQHITLEPARKGDLWYFCCDTRKARDMFGWEAKVLPKEGIAQLVQWIEKERRLFQ
jgi:CDP-paratose 2-epimerase